MDNEFQDVTKVPLHRCAPDSSVVLCGCSIWPTLHFRSLAAEAHYFDDGIWAKLRIKTWFFHTMLHETRTRTRRWNKIAWTAAIHLVLNRKLHEPLRFLPRSPCLKFISLKPCELHCLGKVDNSATHWVHALCACILPRCKCLNF